MICNNKINMFAPSSTVTFEGITIIPVKVQVLISKGLPSFTLVGAPTKVVSEAKERIRTCLGYIDHPLPNKRITVNLSPVDILKEGSHYDLPITIAILKALGVIKNNIDNYLFMGEISLNGKILATNGIVAASIYSKKNNIVIVCSKENIEEISCTNNNNAILVDDISSLIDILNDNKVYNLDHNNQQSASNTNKSTKYDQFKMENILGNELAKRAMIISASGKHHILMQGSPGTGKSMLAKSILSILPSPTQDELYEINTIRSMVYGNKLQGYINNDIPFRDPHTSCSKVALLGGCKKSQIGEITLAHNGILFLDELAEFPANLLDSLRQPLEDKYILVSRAEHKIKYPTNFLLIAAMNPCKCGYFYVPNKKCSKHPVCLQAYTKKISGPIMDRIDIKITLNEIDIFADKKFHYITSEEAKKKVVLAQNIQKERFKNYSINYNADMTSEMINHFIRLNVDSEHIIKKIYNEKNLSIRSYHKILKLARTISDIEQSECVTTNSIKEAIIFAT